MAFDQSLNTQHISANLASYEAARSSFFMLIISDLDNLVKINSEGNADLKESDYIRNAQEILKLNVVKCDMSDFEVSTLTYRRGNDVVNFAGLPTWSAGSLTVDDVVGLDTKSILTAWLHLAYNPKTRKGGLMKDYKKNCVLVEMSQNYETIRTWDLEGCFITKLDNAGWDKEGGDEKRQIQATLVYDRAIMHLPDEE